MAIDKVKIEQTALKYIQKGQFRKAIAEYQRIITVDPKDLRIRIKLIDLYGREGMKNDAIEECKRITSTYIDQGFIPRAIAVWKQALRIDPENPDIFVSMGDLYLEQHLMGDALAAFKKSVDILRKSSRHTDAAKILSRMEELAPDNAAIKAHLAELYLEMEDMEAFAPQLEKMVDQLRSEGRIRKLLTILEGLYEKSGKRIELVRPLVDTYMELGEDDKAIGAVRQGLDHTPHDVDLRVYSVRADLALGNIIDARKVALGIKDEDPDNIYILEQLVAIAQARGDNAELVHSYKDLAQAYARRGFPDKEEYYFSKVLEIVPDDAEALLSVGDLASPLPGGAATMFGDSPDKDPFGGDEFFLDFDATSPEPVASAGAKLQQLVTPLEEGIIEADLYVKYGLEEKALARLKELVASSPDNHAVRAKLRDILWRKDDKRGWLEQQLAIARLFVANGRKNEALHAFESALEVDPSNHEAKEGVANLKGASSDFFEPTYFAVLDQELLRVDRLIEEGDSGEAISILLRLQDQNPGNSEIATRLVDLGWVTSSAEKDAEKEAEDEFSQIAAELHDIDFDVSSIAGFEEVEVSEIDDILKEFKSGVAERLEDGDFDTHYDLGMAYKEMGLLEDSLHEFQKAAKFTEKAKNAYSSMAMVYREIGQISDARAALRMALSVPSNSQEDRAAILYELGLLAEEEGDWEGAISSYVKVTAIEPEHRDVTQRLAQARTRT